MDLVLDASVVIKWFLKEKSSRGALRYRQQHLKGEIALVAPALLPFEIINALCTKPKAGLSVIFGQYPRLQSGVKSEKGIPKEDTPLVATGGLKPPVAKSRFITFDAIEAYRFTGITEYFLTEKLAQAAAQLSKKYKVSAYDAAYMALAQNLGCKFITADRKLYRKIKPLKFVELLGGGEEK